VCSSDLTPPAFFSYMADTIGRDPGEIFTLNRWADPAFHVEQMPCWITHTSPQTHDIIRANLHQSPMYAGVIEGIGPRYCPSIEDKVVRFADKGSHQLFLEPEGRHSNEYYINGVSTSLPYEVQYAFIRSIPALEKAEIIRPGYAVEYDFCPPTQLFPTMETKRVEHLYFAGQINGTSGYEEAAGQGMIAGLNAALKLSGKPAYIPSRTTSYLGVMVDDLVTKGVSEPYRMFTSRAEYRLLLRQDNCDLRLTPRAAEIGLTCPTRNRLTQEKADLLVKAHHFAQTASHEGMKLHSWIRRTENDHSKLPAELRAEFPDPVWQQLDYSLKYEGYVQRQEVMIGKTARMDGHAIPFDFDYTKVHSLKKEAQLRLTEIRPTTLGQAARIQGVTPAEISLIAVMLRKAGATEMNDP
jgi:tRNA uridine 5-carboxymethylaminomethyl modification enzyme